MNEDESKYLEVIEKFQHCQRNWDLEKTVDDETIDYLLEVGYNVPTKQNLNSFKIVCIKDRDEVLKWASIARNSDDTITNVGENTKQFMDKGGLQNPQTNANLLFLFFVNDKERTSTARRERERGEDDSESAPMRLTDKHAILALAQSPIVSGLHHLSNPPFLAHQPAESTFSVSRL